MVSRMSLETCWAIKKHWHNKFYCTVASFWLFLYDLYYDARINEHQVRKLKFVKKKINIFKFGLRRRAVQVVVSWQWYATLSVCYKLSGLKIRCLSDNNVQGNKFVPKPKRPPETNWIAVKMEVLIPMAARCKTWVCGRSLTGIVGSNPAGRMDVSYESFVLSGRGLCVGLISHPEESYRVWFVWVW